MLNQKEACKGRLINIALKSVFAYRIYDPSIKKYTMQGGLYIYKLVQRAECAILLNREISI